MKKQEIYVGFFSGRYDGGEKLLEDVSSIIKRVNTPIERREMYIHDGHSVLMIGSFLIYRGENNIRRALPEITSIIKRCYENEIENKKEVVKVKQENIFLVPITELKAGQFSNEKSIILETADGKKISLFVQNSCIHYCFECKTPFLKTTLIIDSKEMNMAQVLLPNEAFETQSRYADVILNRINI